MNTSMVVETFDMLDQNIAIERMTYFISHTLEDCIFVNQEDKEAIEKYNNAGMRVVEVPEDPYDQILGLLIINKCNAIMEGRLHLSDIVFGSKLSNLIKFELTSEMAINEYPGKHWWNDHTLSTTTKSRKKDKIVKLFDQNTPDWATLELTWTKKSL